jgi:hypothetical protein
MKDIFLKFSFFIFFLFWWVNFEFLYRLDFINFQFDLNLYLIVFLFVTSIFFFKLNFFYLQISKIKNLNYILIFIIIVSIFSLFYSALYIDLPFNLFNRFIVQISSLIINLVLSVVFYYFIISYSYITYRVLVIGYSLLFISVIMQISLFSSISFGRVYGFAGEPKALGIYLVPFLASLYFVGLNHRFLNRFLILFCVLILILTLSSTAFISLFFSFFILSYYLQKSNKSKFYTLFGFFLFFVFIILNIFYFEFNEIILGRIVKRFSGEYVLGTQTAINLPFLGNVVVDGNDAPVIRMFLENPILLLPGVGYGFQTVFSYEYLLNYDSGMLDSFYDGYITPNFALLNHLSNYGIVIFLFIFFNGLKTIKNLMRYINDSSIKFLIIYFSSWFIISSLIYEMTFKIILLFILLKLLEQNFKKRKYV